MYKYTDAFKRLSGRRQAVNQYSYITMINYEMFRPVFHGEIGSSFPLDYAADRKVKYVIEPIEKDEESIDCYHHIPFFLQPDDKPWLHGNLFIRYLIKKSVELGKDIQQSTLDKYAQSIKLFMNYCELHDINYLESKSPIRSPIARYRRYMDDEQTLGNLKASTMKGRLGNIVAFYRYLVDNLKLEFKSCPWLEDVKGMHTYVGEGYSSTKEFLSSSVQRVASSSLTSDEKTYEGCLNDGGEELRPLDDLEATIVFKALHEIGNAEMFLSHMLIYATGARTQTLFTLRQCHFEKDFADNKLTNNEVIIRAGNGELVDSKGGNPFAIRMPIVIYKMVQTYIKSPNAQDRYKKARFQFSDVTHQYVFLTSHGNPYYMANKDFNKIQYRNPPKGGTLRTFISTELKPKMDELGFINPKDRFKFHDLRATFGLGILNSYLRSLPDHLAAGIARDKAVNHVMKYLNHKQKTTSEHYLDFSANSTVGKEVGSQWAQHLIKIAGLKDE